MSVTQLAWVRVVSGIISVVCLWVFMTKFRFAKPRLSMRFARKLLLFSLPFASAQILFTWQFRIDIMLITALTNGWQAGVFSASYRILGMILLLPVGFSYALTPAAFESGRKSGQALNLLFRRSVFASMVLGIPAAAGMSLIAEPVMHLFFTSEYVTHLLPLVPLSWCVPCLLLSSVAMNILWGAGRNYSVTLVFGLGLCVNIALDLYLIPIYGAWGAALGALGGQIATLIVALNIIKINLFPTNIGSLLWAPSLASAVMVVALCLLKTMPTHISFVQLLMKGVLGAIIYLIVLLTLGRGVGLHKKDFWPQIKYLITQSI